MWQWEPGWWWWGRTWQGDLWLRGISHDGIWLPPGSFSLEVELGIEGVGKWSGKDFEGGTYIGPGLENIWGEEG